MIISSNFSDGNTIVENSFIDQYMAKAPGEYVKVYFLLLRRLNSSHINYSVSDLADSLELTEGDILRALKYWAREGLLFIQYNSLGEIISLEVGRFDESEATLATPSFNKEISSNITSFPSKQSYDDTITKSKAMERRALKDLVLLAEQYLGKQLSGADTEKINFYYENLRFSPDLIEYLIEYCAENGHKNWAYINSVAIAWSKANISTVEEAKNQTTAFSKTTSGIFQAFGLNSRKAIPEELSYIKKWREEFGFSEDIIQEACKRTVMRTGKANWSYADKIMENWLQQDVMKLEDIEPLDIIHKNKNNKKNLQKSTTKKSFNNFEGRSYDMGELERQLLERS